MESVSILRPPALARLVFALGLGLLGTAAAAAEAGGDATPHAGSVRTEGRIAAGMLEPGAPLDESLTAGERGPGRVPGRSAILRSNRMPRRSRITAPVALPPGTAAAGCREPAAVTASRHRRAAVAAVPSPLRL